LYGEWDERVRLAKGLCVRSVGVVAVGLVFEGAGRDCSPGRDGVIVPSSISSLGAVAVDRRMRVGVSRIVTEEKQAPRQLGGDRIASGCAPELT